MQGGQCSKFQVQVTTIWSDKRVSASHTLRSQKIWLEPELVSNSERAKAMVP